jgi:hypothetical protein
VYSVNAPAVSEDYLRRAEEIARERLNLAGHRIAAVLNQRM